MAPGAQADDPPIPFDMTVGPVLRKPVYQRRQARGTARGPRHERHGAGPLHPHDGHLRRKMRSVAEIGCAIGEILSQLSRRARKARGSTDAHHVASTPQDRRAGAVLIVGLPMPTPAARAAQPPTD